MLSALAPRVGVVACDLQHAGASLHLARDVIVARWCRYRLSFSAPSRGSATPDAKCRQFAAPSGLARALLYAPTATAFGTAAFSPVEEPCCIGQQYF